MAFSAAEWVRATKSVYFGNASNVRDFRTQLRGNRPIWLWLSYLLILILVVALAYNSIVETQSGSIAQVQRRLGEFYQIIMAMLGGIIAIVTPSLTATTVVAERQRKSLDLVFSAPVSLKYYLVGKMLSSLRYTWMLLILALPVTAVCVVMGGATWQDVLSAYVLLTGASLVFTSLGLLLSVVSNTLVSAVLWTYVVAGAYCIIASFGSAIPTVVSSMYGTRNLEMNWMVGISPFTVSFAAPTYTTLWGHQIPNWIFVSIYSVMVCKLFLAGAASAMSPFGSSETKGFRVHVLAYVALFTYIVGVSLVPPMAATIRSAMGSGPIVTPSRIDYLWIIPAWITFAMTLGLPTYACFNRNEDRKYRPDGMFSVLRIFIGSPSGSLPFALAMIAAMYLTLMVAMVFSGVSPDTTTMVASLIWSFTFTFFWWAVARLASAIASTLKMARIIYTAVFILVIALPLPVLSIIEASRVMSGSSIGGGAFQIHMLYPLTQPDRTQVLFLVYSILMLIPASAMTAISHFLVLNPRKP